MAREVHHLSSRSLSETVIRKGRIATGVLLFLLGGSACGQTNSLVLSSGSAVAGASVSLELSLNASASPSGLQWTFSYPGDVTSIQIFPGPALTAADKTLLWSNRAGSIVCLASGINANGIGNGVIAVATITLAPLVTSPAITLGIENVGGVTADGSATLISGTSGVISVQGLVRPTRPPNSSPPRSIRLKPS